VVQKGRQGANVVLRVARLGDPLAEGRSLRYRRDGGDWVDLGAGRSLVLSGLSSGSHVLELESDPLQRFTVMLPRPWWAQPRFWIPLALSLAVAGSVFLTFALRRRREAKKWAREKAELERMALRLQMNPHFTFNALESISSFVLEQKPREAVQYLNRFARLMRYTLEKAEQERVALSDELDALAHYVALEQMRFDRQFDFVLEVDEALDAGDLAIPPMLLQPLVENAILHGLRPLVGRRGCLTLRVLQAVEPGRLRIEVEDNGVGRGAASAQRTGDEGQKRSMATRILASRLKALSEATGSPFSQSVEDLNEGTRVVLALPKDELWGS
jgi:LytS/YehU family sensor histidine kinase